MSIFSRIGNFLRSTFIGPSHDEQVREEVHEVIAEEFGEEDELVEIWNEAVEDNLTDADDLKEFALDSDGIELFRVGWVDEGDNPDERQAARDAFFDLMEAYDISRDEFDWDAWRDWYEDA